MNYERLSVVLIALGLIGAGLYHIQPSYAPIGIGALLWIDLTIEGLRNERNS